MIHVPKKNMFMKSLILIGRIETKIIERKIRQLFMKYQNLKYVLCDESNTFDNNGFMRIVHNRLYPGESSVAFTPMIGLKANDETYILSTMIRHYTKSPTKYNKMSDKTGD